MPMWPVPRVAGYGVAAVIAVGGALAISFQGNAQWYVYLVQGATLLGVVAALLWAVRRTGNLPMFALLGCIGTLALVFSLDAFTLVASATWAGIGLLVYAFYGVRHSKEAHARHATGALADPFHEGRPAGTTNISTPAVTHLGYTHGLYGLYARDTATGAKSYFFAKGTPKAGAAAQLPRGFEVGVNERTGLPFLRRKA